MAKWIILMLLLVSIVEARHSSSKVYNVRNYDASANGKNDDSKAFLNAWGDACNSSVSTSVVIPKGTYMLNPIVFSGPCKASITFELKGTLIAPTNNPSSDTTWINFRYLNQLTVTGSGILDGQGASAWGRKNGNPVLMTLGFAFVNNTNIKSISSINSQNAHITMFKCENMTLSNLSLTAPHDSPNTDGIKMAKSQGINIDNVHIATGDDCIAMITGTKNVNISNVYCGPGHGISIGSFGNNSDEFDIQDISVKRSTLNGTSNGLRIKTWATKLNHPLKASNIVYEDITIIDVFNPINIDQEYCPTNNCGNKVPSGVKISNVSYKNIQGTCRGDVAVNFRCSASNPCQNISLENIDLVRTEHLLQRLQRHHRHHHHHHHRQRQQPNHQRQTPLRNICSNVHGASHGKQNPQACL